MDLETLEQPKAYLDSKRLGCSSRAPERWTFFKASYNLCSPDYSSSSTWGIRPMAISFLDHMQVLICIAVKGMQTVFNLVSRKVRLLPALFNIHETRTNPFANSERKLGRVTYWYDLIPKTQMTVNRFARVTFLWHSEFRFVWTLRLSVLEIELCILEEWSSCDF